MQQLHRRSIDHAVRLGMKGILLIGHVGETDQGGGRSDEYALQTGGLQDGSICFACGDGGADPETVKKNYGKYYNSRNDRTA